MRAGMRKGLTIFSTAFVIYLLAIVLSIILGIYSIIIILPIISPLLHIFEMVSFFSSQGMRYYVDNDTILSPKKLEEVDKLEDAKYIL
jgi:1,4-dihydroxy-2-naphthoate octaprenyltransferase